MERGAVIEVSWMARRAIQTKSLARKSLPSTMVVGFGEFDSFIGAPIREAMYQDTTHIWLVVHGINDSRELCLLKG